jgi:hypothetical protein
MKNLWLANLAGTDDCSWEACIFRCAVGGGLGDAYFSFNSLDQIIPDRE